MKAVTISNLRNRIKYFFNLVVESSEVLIIPRTSNEDDSVVILSLKEYNSLTETNYLMSTEVNRKRMLESIQQLEKGKLIPFEPDEEIQS